MPEDQDLEVLRAVVTASTDQQASERTHDEGQEEQHRGMVGEPPVRCESRFRTPSRFPPADLARSRVGLTTSGSTSDYFMELNVERDGIDIGDRTVSREEHTDLLPQVTLGP
jgi:ABC-type nitrate/sulfonate/bicarbonate transport system substrate-binding protein